jgi:alkylhydroperoxidase family enzyme
MSDSYADLIDRLEHAVLFQPGVLSPDMRQAAASTAGELPEVLSRYVEKVTTAAYTVTDEDVQSLLQAGYSDDAIFELTVSAALGAGLMRLKRGLASLEEGNDDATT